MQNKQQPKRRRIQISLFVVVGDFLKRHVFVIALLGIFGFVFIARHTFGKIFTLGFGPRSSHSVAIHRNNSPNTTMMKTSPRLAAMKPIANPCKRRRPAQAKRTSTTAQTRLMA
ncbi:hypothetical protein Tcan_07152 [Toxocara canis]|uniref:Uncharacterized protein n=1 Tax=Toxocara canis TaxID=6265 RepID=A0A0B2VAY7_TOXCA|nr:hypothetical protein Tcan_07152 [Toxocara canis]